MVQENDIQNKNIHQDASWREANLKILPKLLQSTYGEVNFLSEDSD